MRKFLFLLLFCALFLHAKEKVEIYATSITAEGNTVVASDEVIVVYGTYFLRAKRAVYNKQNGDLELFENIRANYNGEYKLLGSYAKINIANKERLFQPFYMLEKKSEVWLSGDTGYALEDDLLIEAGVTSGCDPIDPLWKIEFSSSEYNTESKWLNLYNARLYLYDIPVIYTPYFGYPLDKTRRTGLLLPAFGISGSEGFYYEQPFYIAEQNWWDAEFKPQIRTLRGEGIYGEFRFVDSPLSRGSLQTGYFREKPSYAREYELINDKHFGFNFEYESKDIAKSFLGISRDAQTGLYVDIHNMNDVDYLNLATNDTTQTITATQILSRINGFYNGQKNYLAAYFKYYKDLTLESNENILQKLPTLHYHSYLNTLWKNHFFYNIDLQSNNIYREVNKKAIQTNVAVPLTLQTSLFDEYLQLAYTAELYAQHSKFSGDEEVRSGEYENGYYARNHHVLKASTQLAKGFENFTHVFGLGATLIAQGSDTQNGYYEEYESFCARKENQMKPQCEFYTISEVQDTLKLDFTQYFYDQEAKQKLYHRLTQNIDYNKESNELGELENELDAQLSDTISYYNNFFYNYDEKAFSKIFNQIAYRDESWNFSLSHLYRDTFLEETSAYTPYTSYITSTLRYTYDEHYSYHAGMNYDYENREKKSSEIGFMYKKRCWDFGLRYVENVRPVLRTGDTSSIYDRYLYISVVLKPLMGSGSRASDFALRLPEKLKEN